MSKFPELTAAHDFEGTAGAVLWAAKVPPDQFTEVYPGSRQWAYTPVLRGHNGIYDPRDGKRKFTNNAALIIAHWITEVLGQRVNWDAVAIEADHADTLVTDADGIERPKWTLNGRIRDDESYEAQRGQLVGACDGYLFERPDGTVGFFVGRWIEPTVTLSSGDFTSVEVTEGQWGVDAPTEVAVTYTEPDNAWREASAGIWVEEASLRAVTDEPQMFMITNHDQAVRMAKRIAASRRPQFQLRGTIGFAGYELLGQRFFAFRNAALDIDATFEISELRRTSSSTFEVIAVSSQASDFDFDATTETPPRPKFGSVVSSFTTPEIVGVTVTSGNASSLNVAWPAQPDYLWQQIRWRVSPDGDWQSFTTTAPEVAYTITGLTDGTDYDVQVRNVSAPLINRPSDWSPEPALTAVAVQNQVPPGALTAFDVSVSGSDAVVTFVAPNDPNYFGARIWRSATSDFSAAVLVHTEFGIPSNGDSWTDIGLSLGDYFYWAIPINGSGIEGARSGPISATII
ncbi:MAG: fibronectin type III domain-containing protein [Erythrobacter sp.]|nr:fibronectin type III domain-containing protein [Erythrobacter sp.]